MALAEIIAIVEKAMEEWEREDPDAETCAQHIAKSVIAAFEVTAENTFETLDRIARETKCKPGWTFHLADEDGAKRLVITIAGVDNYDHSRKRTVSHYHPVPITTYNEQSWRRWIFEQCIRTMHHELGESLRFGPDEVRPFAPMHGPGEDPYTVHEWRPEIDALTTQDGSIRPGPV
jgi:hypothetical protein